MWHWESSHQASERSISPAHRCPAPQRLVALPWDGSTTLESRKQPCRPGTAKPISESLSFPKKGIKLEIQGPKLLYFFLHV